MLQREAPSCVAASPARTDCSTLPGQVRLSPLGEQPRGHLVPDIWGFLQQGGHRVLICYGPLAPRGVRNFCNRNRNTPGVMGINCPPDWALWNSLLGWTLERRGLWERMAPPGGPLSPWASGHSFLGHCRNWSSTPAVTKMLGKHWLACRPVRAVSQHRVVPQTHLIYSCARTSASAAPPA